jgi:hypothetical protein
MPVPVADCIARNAACRVREASLRGESARRADPVRGRRKLPNPGETSKTSSRGACHPLTMVIAVTKRALDARRSRGVPCLHRCGASMPTVRQPAPRQDRVLSLNSETNQVESRSQACPSKPVQAWPATPVHPGGIRRGIWFCHSLQPLVPRMLPNDGLGGSMDSAVGWVSRSTPRPGNPRLEIQFSPSGQPTQIL